ncbi:MAG: ABC transporter ATP-binding protein [Clostridia bacterium]|nr:ABC transporter ATP-binding protein [Clostridia bacterium]
MILDAKDISVKFRHGALAISGLTFSVDKGQILTVMGDNECGKTSLLKAIAGLYPITDGELFFYGKNVNEIAPKDKKICLMHEDGGFFNYRSVRFNLEYPLRLRGEKLSDKSMRFISPDILKKKIKQLTKEERLSVMFERINLRTDAEIILIDDPFKVIHDENREKLFLSFLPFMRSLTDRAAVIYATTERTEAEAIGAKTLLLHYGVEQQYGDPRDFSTDPSSLCALYFSQADYTSGLTVIEEGDPPHFTIEEKVYPIDKEKLLNKIYIGKEVIYAKTDKNIFLFDKKCEARIY